MSNFIYFDSIKFFSCWMLLKKIDFICQTGVAYRNEWISYIANGKVSNF